MKSKDIYIYLLEDGTSIDGWSINKPLNSKYAKVNNVPEEIINNINNYKYVSGSIVKNSSLILSSKKNELLNYYNEKYQEELKKGYTISLYDKIYSFGNTLEDKLKIRNSKDLMEAGWVKKTKLRMYSLEKKEYVEVDITNTNIQELTVLSFLNEEELQSIYEFGIIEKIKNAETLNELEQYYI